MGGLASPVRGGRSFGEDIGQQSWLSAEEQDRLIAWLDLRPEHLLLDVACGSGGPTLRIVERTGCRVHGIDLEAAATRVAKASVRKRGLTDRAAFAVADASRPLDFAPQSFDAIVNRRRKPTALEVYEQR
jgi:cyclopropane fatty-acyl-phospholipid synthase-like methyltransferase